MQHGQLLVIGQEKFLLYNFLPPFRLAQMQQNLLPGIMKEEEKNLTKEKKIKEG